MLFLYSLLTTSQSLIVRSRAASVCFPSALSEPPISPFPTATTRKRKKECALSLGGGRHWRDAKLARRTELDQKRHKEHRLVEQAMIANLLRSYWYGTREL